MRPALHAVEREVASPVPMTRAYMAGLLGHLLSSGITVRYAHVPDVALVAAADHVAACVEAALEGCASAEIVPLAGGSKDAAEHRQSASPRHPIRILKFAQICAI